MPNRSARRAPNARASSTQSSIVVVQAARRARRRRRRCGGARPEWRSMSILVSPRAPPRPPWRFAGQGQDGAVVRGVARPVEEVAHPETRGRGGGQPVDDLEAAGPRSSSERTRPARGTGCAEWGRRRPVTFARRFFLSPAAARAHPRHRSVVGRDSPAACARRASLHERYRPREPAPALQAAALVPSAAAGTMPDEAVSFLVPLGNQDPAPPQG